MSIWVGNQTKLLVQGITGSAGSFHAMGCREYGTNVVGGVTPGKGGMIHEGFPVFNTCKEAVDKTGANAAMIFVPPPFAADAVMEAAEAGLKVIICITEGIPVQDMVKVKEVNKKLNDESQNLIKKMLNTSTVKSFMQILIDEFVDKRNSELKTKVITTKDVREKDLSFNPSSPKQLQRLLYSEDFLGFPIIDLTDTGLPATGGDTLEKLIKHTTDPATIEFLKILIEYKASAIILSTFLPAFLKAELGNDGWHYLFGNFKLGGTQSGRLASNNPNLQNIPSSGANKLKKRLAKMIKSCFVAPEGWIFTGLDFDSLEDKISAVTTKDPQKIKVYSDGFDGHCLRAYAYFKESMPDIEMIENNETAYKAILGNHIVYFHSNEEIIYLGVKLKGKDLAKKLGIQS